VVKNFRANLCERFKMAKYIQVSVFILLLAVIYYFTRSYFAGCVCRSNVTLKGKTVVITGANTGIGKETALDLATRGARVIMACRNLIKAEAALKEVVEKSRNKDVVVKHLDLASLKSVRDFAEDINNSEPRLDVLINNAGVAYLAELTKTQDGFEMTMGVNHLGHFLLTNLLLELLKKSAPSRIVIVASSAHRFVGKELDLENLNSELSYSRFYPYFNSKLANILFNKELARHLKGSGVTVNSLHPGVIIGEAELLRHFPSFLQTTVSFLTNPFGKTAKQGAQTSIYLAMSEDVEGVSGSYFKDCAVTEPSAPAQDDVMAKKLWDVSQELVGLNTTI
jgi:NAD(P)-dependent dehydrogenase (short-subunit alcohol dehydrogenase family)